MSDRGEHLLGKRTGRQLIHYSVNGGIIQAGGVCIQMCVCVSMGDSCLCFLWLLVKWKYDQTINK